MKILIPPSEGKSTANQHSTTFRETNSSFAEPISKILDSLKEIAPSRLTKIYGTSTEKSLALHELNLNIFDNHCSEAITRYTGTVYKNLDPASFERDSKDYLNQNVRITSALMGLVAPDTLIPNYKLKMNVLNLTEFWNPYFSGILSQEDLVIDLLPQIHRKAYTKTDNTIVINFNVKKGEKIVPAGHFGKVIKGKFVKFLVENRITDITEVKRFEEDDFSWDNTDNAFIKIT